MARLSSLQKAERVLRFVLALRNPKISGVLVAHGFGPADLDEVWTLFRAAAPVSFARPRPVDNQVDEARQRIRVWQRRWMPVIKASLSRHMPVVAEVWRSMEKAPSEPTLWALSFVAFYDSMRASRTGHAGKEARAAIKLLAARGLGADVVEDLRVLTTILTTFPSGAKAARLRDAVPDTTPDNEEAIGKLWAWYLEWGRVVRTQVDDGRVLRQAGFLSGDRRAKPVRRKTSGEGTGPGV